jgi:beta-galactosidase
MAGEIDATGRLRPAAYYRQVLWRTGLTPTSAFVEWPGAEGSLPDKTANGPTALRSWVQPDLHPSWSGFNSDLDAMPVKVVAFSENDEVELFVNGKSIGRKPVSKSTEYKAEFFVRYEPGTLKAVGYVGGKPVSEWVIETAGKPEAVRLSVDRARIAADGDDLAYVTAQLVDAQGRPTYVRKDDKRLVFEVHGAGVLAGVGNGDPVALESFQSGARSTFHGRAVAVVRATRAPGSAVVDVTGPDLPPTSVTIAVE